MNQFTRLPTHSYTHARIHATADTGDIRAGKPRARPLSDLPRALRHHRGPGSAVQHIAANPCDYWMRSVSVHDSMLVSCVCSWPHVRVYFDAFVWARVYACLYLWLLMDEFSCLCLVNVSLLLCLCLCRRVHVNIMCLGQPL